MKVKVRDIPHLAKNERDMGHPVSVARKGSFVSPFRNMIENCSDATIFSDIQFLRTATCAAPYRRFSPLPWVISL
jgi:hypothetical protein